MYWTIVLIVVALSLQLPGNDASGSIAPGKLELLCNNKQVQLTRISELSEIINHLEQNGSPALCPISVRNSLFDLKSLIDGDRDDVCSMSKVQQIRNYYLKYIEGAGEDAPLSTGLRNFFLAYGLRVSSICKKNMNNNLLHDAHNLLTPEDFETMRDLTRGNGLVDSVIASPNDYDDLILASEIGRLMASDSPGQKLLIQTATGHLIRKIQVACDQRFKPIYGRLITPLVELANMGFNYQSEELKFELEEMSTNEEIQTWYKIVYLCDSLSGIAIVEDEDNKEQAEGLGDKKLIRVLTAEEGAEAGVVPVIADEELKPEKQIVFKVEGGNPINDELFETDDKEFKKLVSNFQLRKSESDRIRAKILRKIGQFMKDSIMKGNFHIVGLMFGRKGNGEAESSDNVKDDIVKTLDEYMHRQTAADSPVAGVYGYAKRVYHQGAYLGPSGAMKKMVAKTSDAFPVYTYFWRAMAVLIFIVGIVLVSSFG